MTTKKCKNDFLVFNGKMLHELPETIAGKYARKLRLFEVAVRKIIVKV